MAVPNPERLPRRADFLRVARLGRKYAAPGLVLQVLPHDPARWLRAGFTVTRKIGNAVTRNRARRRLREALRLTLRDEGVAGADVVLVGRDATARRRFDLLLGDMRRTLADAGLL